MSAVTGRKLKVLCLHGYKQNDLQFKNRTNALRKSLKKLVEFHYITAPNKILYEKKQNEADQKTQSTDHDNNVNSNIPNNADAQYLPKSRAWWTFTNDKTKYVGIEESLKYISNEMQTNGPFDGILGFSQGGVVAMMICLMKTYPKYFEKIYNLSSDITKLPEFKFIWMIGASLPKCIALQPLIDSIVTNTDNNTLIDNISLLLVIGTKDKYLSNNWIDITKCFNRNNQQIVKHDGGHYIPSNKVVKSQYVKFLMQMQTLCN